MSYLPTALTPSAIGFLDVLGFKDIWKRIPPEEVFAQLANSRTRLRERTIEMGQNPRAIVEPIFVSDTLVLAAPIIDTVERAVELVCMFAASTQGSLAARPPHLALRGCITVGEAMWDERTFLGPAVSKAAAHERQAEGAFIWLHPDVVSELHRDQCKYLERLAFEYDVPMKNKGPEESTTLVVNPFSTCSGTSEVLDDWMENILSGFVLKADNSVENKLRNTAALLRVAKERAVSGKRLWKHQR